MTNRLDKHLAHITDEVVPQRGAAQQGMTADYIQHIQARQQPPLLVRGIEQWNAGQFYDQHETLEFLWRATPDAVRDVFKGIIQSGVGAYHILNHNRRGALGKWTGALGYLAPFVDIHPYGIEVGKLRGEIETLRESLLAEDDDTIEWDTYEDQVLALQVCGELRIAEPKVTDVLRYIDRCWQNPRTGMEAALARLTPEIARWIHPKDNSSIVGWVLWAGNEKAESLRTIFGVETEPVTPNTEWRLLERWLSNVHHALRAHVGFMTDTTWSVTFSEEVSRLMLNDEYAAAEIRKMRELLA